MNAPSTVQRLGTEKMGGDSALAVFAIVNRLYSALNTPKTGIMQGMQPILGYNFGQKSFGRVQKTMIYSLAAAVVYGLLVCGLCLLIPVTLITLLSEAAVVQPGLGFGKVGPVTGALKQFGKCCRLFSNNVDLSIPFVRII